MSVWKSLVMDNHINVFVGDFFNPYTYAISFEDCKRNFLEIIEYKRAHPETVFLYGNHELHYLFYGEISKRYSRFDETHATEIQQLCHKNAKFHITPHLSLFTFLFTLCTLHFFRPFRLKIKIFIHFSRNYLRIWEFLLTFALELL